MLAAGPRNGTYIKSPIDESITYQDIIAAYEADKPEQGKQLMIRVIDTLRAGLPSGLTELRTLGRTLHRRRDDILAYFDHRSLL